MTRTKQARRPRTPAFNVTDLVTTRWSIPGTPRLPAASRCRVVEVRGDRLRVVCDCLDGAWWVDAEAVEAVEAVDASVIRRERYAGR